MSARRIVGFACIQAFVFFLLFMSAGQEVERFGLLFALLFMVVGFGVVRLLGPKRFSGVFARPLLYVYAVAAAGGSLLGLLTLGDEIAVAAAQGLVVGVPSSFLLTAWGRAFGRESSEVAVPEVFLGSLVGALVCLVFSFVPDSTVVLVAVRLLPLASVVNIDFSRGAAGAADADAGADAGAGAASAAGADGASEGKARLLSFKILAGTVLFGMAAGLVLMLNAGPSGYYQVSLVLYGAFLIGGLSLLLSDGFGRGAALNKSYRLAVFVMLMGVLVMPWPLMAASVIPGEAVVLAGFLGLEVVLVSLFVVIAEITGTDCALSFSAGFTALYAGGLAGVFVAAGLAEMPDVVAVLAGAIVLVSYIFLFTERDFDDLSQLVTENEEMTVERRAAELSERYGLSNRESEILVYALRGRTSERIAQELVISKSTVDTHLRRIYAKCNVHSRQELLDLAGL